MTTDAEKPQEPLSAPLGTGRTSPYPRKTLSRSTRWIAAAAVLAVYVAVLLGTRGLSLPLQRDELVHWPISVGFSKTWLPTLHQLVSYHPALTTPLSFLVFGFVQHLFHGGIVVARLVNFLVSLAVALWIATVRRRDWGGLLAAAGLLVFPYYLGASVLLYTDIIAVALALLGVALHLSGRPVWAIVPFVLAIATRQFMLAFPVALCAWELWRMRAEPARLAAVWVAPLLASLTIFGWYALYGGFAPPLSMAEQPILTASFLTVIPQQALYFLTTIGAYFVVPEAVLLNRRWPFVATVREHWRGALGVAVGLAVLFAVFPPLGNTVLTPTMGFFDKAMHRVLPATPRMVLYWALATAAVLRFLGDPLALVLLGCNAAALLKSPLAWDKYAIALLVVYWYFASRGLFARGWAAAAAGQAEPARGSP